MQADRWSSGHYDSVPRSDGKIARWRMEQRGDPKLESSLVGLVGTLMGRKWVVGADRTKLGGVGIGSSGHGGLNPEQRRIADGDVRSEVRWALRTDRLCRLEAHVDMGLVLVVPLVVFSLLSPFERKDAGNRQSLRGLR